MVLVVQCIRVSLAPPQLCVAKPGKGEIQVGCIKCPGEQSGGKVEVTINERHRRTDASLLDDWTKQEREIL